MNLEMLKILILIIVSLAIFKKSFDWGMLPYGVIVVFGCFGLLFRGFYGLLISLVAGYIITILLGSFSGIGLFRKKDRKLMAENFFQNNKEEILSLKGFADLNNKKIINIFSDYINEIYGFSNKLENPVKRHSHDYETARLRPNFKNGAINWLLKFNDKERGLMEKYINFLDYTIYKNPDLISSKRS